MKFYLGTHIPSWLETINYPLFVSNRRLWQRRSLPRAIGPWALDSGGFSELSMYGEWRTTPESYVHSVRRYVSEIGNLDWAAIQDWMCEDFILKKTGRSIQDHQKLTIFSYVKLKTLAPEINWTPVLQGFSLTDYLSHVDMYFNAGITLTEFSTVGVGSICRRQHTSEAEVIIETLAKMGLKLHGFGFKLLGLKRTAHLLTSADSMAWSFVARYDDPLVGHSHKTCANCSEYALQWRERVIAL